tara:strand:+ start:114 stop:584 length:471 start_codon:yes stop_codon:yes gene_type:complete
MHFDVMICTDCWWNLPQVIVDRILQHPTTDKIHCNSWDPVKFAPADTLAHLETMTDMQEFMERYGRIKTVKDRPANVLIAGQGWKSGTHNEKLGVRALSTFVPTRLRIFVDTQLVARATQELDRTMRESDMQDDHHIEWKHVEGTVYEMQGVKNAW